MSPRDRISYLPENVIHGILQCLPLRDAARTSILSKKWRENWLTLPALVLDGYFFRDVLGKRRRNSFQYSSIVSKILLQHKGPIAKFTLHIPKQVLPDITQWISFLSMNFIKEFTLINWEYMPTLQLPSHLFACANLTKLKLDCFYFNPLPSFKGFPNLLSLGLDNICLLSEHTFGDFVAKCPLLEKLSLRDFGEYEQPHLVINAPKLKYLTVYGVFQSIYLNGCQGLLSVSITLKKLVEHHSKKRAQELIHFLASSSKVERICFRRYFVKSLVNGGVSGRLPVFFTHVRILQLASVDSSKELSCAIGLIRNCPNIERLNISVKNVQKRSNTVEPNLNSDLSCKFLRLRNINVRLNRGSDSELLLIEFLLACSPVLETFDLEIREEHNAEAKLKISQKLKQFRKASSNQIFIISMNSNGVDETTDSDTDEDVDSDSYCTSSDSSSDSELSSSDDEDGE